MILINKFTAILSLTFSLNAWGQGNCIFKIDTAKILANRSLTSYLLALQSDTFMVTNNKKDIPRFIKRQLNCLTHGFSMANPDKKYQATDVVGWRIKPLPRRQLVFLAKSNHILVLTYYIGGIGRSNHLLLIKFKDKKILDFWTGSCLNGMETKQGIIDNINQNRHKVGRLNSNMIYF